uniref:Calcineurin-like phosphoesterase domain-containing protein n=3 Tax=Physcomitrium patens TaxID=3218 RepID=A0A7I4F7E3_PHYPA
MDDPGVATSQSSPSSLPAACKPFSSCHRASYGFHFADRVAVVVGVRHAGRTGPGGGFCWAVVQLVVVVILLADMASLAVVSPLNSLRLSTPCSAGRDLSGLHAEGLRSQGKVHLSWLGHGIICGARNGAASGAQDFLNVGASTFKVGVRCGAFELNDGIGAQSDNELVKKSLGDESVAAIQFEGGQYPPTVVYAPDRRIIAIGDLHGDFERAQWALQLAGVMSKDGKHRWTGGTTVLVQIGDVLDRGEDEITILSLLAWLGKQARSKGGAVFQILGNHETMNVAGDFRYVAPGGFQEAEAFAEYCESDHGGNWDAAFELWHEASQELKKHQAVDFTGWLPMFNPIKMQKGVAARTKLLSPGGPLARQLADHGVVLKVNDWLFAHGGVLPHHVEYGLERMNREVSLWMKNINNRWGQPAQMPFIAVKGFDSIVWSRLYSKENFDRPQERIQACGILTAALSATNSRGLIVGHTPQTIGANSKCDGRIWRIDVGMSSGVLHALPEVLEIVDDKVRILSVAEEFRQEEEEPAEESTWNGKMEVQNYRS